MQKGDQRGSLASGKDDALQTGVVAVKIEKPPQRYTSGTWIKTQILEVGFLSLPEMAPCPPPFHS